MAQTIFTEEQLKESIGNFDDDNDATTVKITSEYQTDPANYNDGVLPQDNNDQPVQEPVADWRESIPEQFRADTQEESLAKMAQAYNELNENNAKAQERLQELDKPKLTPSKVENAEEAFGKVVGNALIENNVDWEGMRERFFNYQELTSSDYDRLEKAGINPYVFENHLMVERTDASLEYKNAQEKELQQKQQSQEKKVLSNEDTTTILKEYADGNVNTFKQMTQWGLKNLGADTMKGIENAVNTGDINITRAAISGLRTAYIASQGQEKPLAVTGGRSPSYGLGPVDSQEAQKIFNDPRYRSRSPADRAWRAQQLSRKWL